MVFKILSCKIDWLMQSNQQQQLLYQQQQQHQAAVSKQKLQMQQQQQQQSLLQHQQHQSLLHQVGYLCVFHRRFLNEQFFGELNSLLKSLVCNFSHSLTIICEA